MNMKKTLIAAALASVLAVPAMADTTITIKEPEVRTIVTTSGYAEPTIVVREGQFWRVKTMDVDADNEVTLFVDAQGNILGASEVAQLALAGNTEVTTITAVELDKPFTPDTAAMIAMNAGFHNVHDIDYLDSRGVWKLEADDIRGEDYELHVDPKTGAIVHIEDD